MCIKYKFNLTHAAKTKINKIFHEIKQIENQINGDRKRMINLNYILKQLLGMRNLNQLADNIPNSKSRKTMEKNNQYWKYVLELIGKKIETIIHGKHNNEIKKINGKMVIIS